MRFSDGMWLLRPGVNACYPVEVESATADSGQLIVWATTIPVAGRGDTINRPLLKFTFISPSEGVIGVRVEHFTGALPVRPAFALNETDFVPQIQIDEKEACLISGSLTVKIARRGPWAVRFFDGQRFLTGSTGRSLAYLTVEPGTLSGGRQLIDSGELSGAFMREQLSLGVGERVYGLGERFGAFAKNGQSIEIWNQDGGTTSEQAYKNVPFYVTSGGYGVLVNHPESVSFEVASEMVEATQFSVSGESLEYFVFAGPTPKDVLRRYTGLTGRAPLVPAWSYGLWLSTSFTTDYSEPTVMAAIDEMDAHGIPLSVFHFDSFWMRPYRWCDFAWDPAAFPDPASLLKRLHDRGLRVCVWINPYLGQRSPLFEQAVRHGYLLKRGNGEPFQCDWWQAGMGIVDLTNPEAREWWTGLLESVLDTGVDCFKVDFGERIPVDDIVWADGSDPCRMHNYYSLLYTQTVYDVIARKRGADEAVVFARSASVGSQKYPVHWGGDSWSTFSSMAETLRGGLSFAMSGFAYWSHDIGGFEGTPDPDVFTRWVPFGLLSSHSRLHGAGSMRLPWLYGEAAVEATRRFTRLKLRLMPYLAQLAREAHEQGVPLMRPMVLECPDDPAVRDIDTQFMLGDKLLVAPVFRADGVAQFYVPDICARQGWVSLLDNSESGPGWVRRTYDLTSLPLLLRPDSVVPWGACDDRPDYDWADGVTLLLCSLADGHDERLVIPASDAGTGARDVVFDIRRTGNEIIVETDSDKAWALQIDDQVMSYEAGVRQATIDIADAWNG